MTVAIGIQTPSSPKPSRAVPLFQKHTNKRWPPMANRNTLPYKLTLISKEKLAREATAPDPNLRRCVAHFRLHCGSVEWTEKDMKSRISSFEFEETDEEDEDDLPELKKQESGTQKTFVNVHITETTTQADAVSKLSPETSSCMEMTSNTFCCISVAPVAG